MASRNNGVIESAGEGRMDLICGKIPLQATCSMHGHDHGTLLTGEICTGPASIIGCLITVHTINHEAGVINISKH